MKYTGFDPVDVRERRSEFGLAVPTQVSGLHDDLLDTVQALSQYFPWMDRNCCDEPSSVIEFVVGVAVDLVPIDARLVMFCWITEPFRNADRVSGVGVVSSSFVHLGTFFDGTGASCSLWTPVLIRLSTSWTPPPPETQHGFSHPTNENALAMVDTIRLFNCLWPLPCCACGSGQRVLREMELDTSQEMFELWLGASKRWRLNRSMGEPVWFETLLRQVFCSICAVATSLGPIGAAF